MDSRIPRRQATTTRWLLNLETAVGRKKDVQGIGVDGEIKKSEVTSVVMRHFFILPGAPRACADFCDPIAVSRLKYGNKLFINMSPFLLEITGVLFQSHFPGESITL